MEFLWKILTQHHVSCTPLGTNLYTLKKRMWLNNGYLGGRGYKMTPKTLLSKVLDWKKLTQYSGHIYVPYGKGGFCSGSGATEPIKTHSLNND